MTDSSSGITEKAVGELLSSSFPTFTTGKRVCEKHGEWEFKDLIFTDGSTRPDKCPKCVEAAKPSGTDFNEKEAEKSRQFRVQTILARSGIPPRYMAKDFDSYIPTCADSANKKQIIMDYADNFPNAMACGTCLVFLGDLGTGKTHLACATIKRIAEKHEQQGLFTTSTKMLRAVKSTYNKSSKVTEEQAIRQFTSVALLVIDEIGVQFDTDNERNIMFEIINERYEAMKPTIMMTNLDLDKLEAYVGSRVSDRLREGGGRFLSFDWDSGRK